MKAPGEVEPASSLPVDERASPITFTEAGSES
jgi:hypothetical protein